MRRPGLIAAFAVLLGFVCHADDLLDRARRINAEALGVDSHLDTLQRVLIEHKDIGKRLPDGHVDFVRLREGGTKTPFFALWVPTFYKGAEAVRRTLQLRDAMQSVLDAYPDQIALASTVEDIERIHKAGKIAAILTIEGGHAIDDDLAVLRTYYRLGIRSITLAHFKGNNWVDSSTSPPVHNGLTEFGKQVIHEMNRLGMLVDISHVSDKSFYDVLKATTQPVIASHSSCRVLSNVPRNMTDDMLRALAKNGGVVGINFSPAFVRQEDADVLMKSVQHVSGREPDLKGKALDQYAASNYLAEFGKTPQGVATVDDVVKNIDHAVKVAGIDHVGIGTDYDGISTVPRGLEDISKMPYVTAGLLRLGYSEADIKKILGGNFMRVMRQVIK